MSTGFHFSPELTPSPSSAAVQAEGLMEKVGKSLCSKMVFSGSMDFSSPVSPLSPTMANSRTDSPQRALASHGHLAAHA